MAPNGKQLHVPYSYTWVGQGRKSSQTSEYEQLMEQQNFSGPALLCFVPCMSPQTQTASLYNALQEVRKQ